MKIIMIGNNPGLLKFFPRKLPALLAVKLWLVLFREVINWDVGCFRILYLVQDVVRTRILHLYHNVGMQEVWCDHVWHKRSVLVLEHNGHNVIPYMSLSLQLKHKEGGTEIIMKAHCLLLYNTLHWLFNPILRHSFNYVFQNVCGLSHILTITAL